MRKEIPFKKIDEIPNSTLREGVEIIVDYYTTRSDSIETFDQGKNESFFRLALASTFGLGFYRTNSRRETVEFYSFFNFDENECHTEAFIEELTNKSGFFVECHVDGPQLTEGSTFLGQIVLVRDEYIQKYGGYDEIVADLYCANTESIKILDVSAKKIEYSVTPHRESCTLIFQRPFFYRNNKYLVIVNQNEPVAY